MLPWKKAKNERVGYEQKERLFMGDYAEQLGDLKPYIDIMTKYLENCRARSVAVVDFPFFGNILEQMAHDWKITGKEPLDWMPDPCGYRNISRVDAAKKAKEKMTSSKKNHKQSQVPPPSTTAAAPSESPPPPPTPQEDEFNFLPVIPLEPVMIKEKETVKEKIEAKSDTAAAKLEATTTTKKLVNDVQTPSDGSYKNVKKDENDKVAGGVTTDKKNINAIRKVSSSNRRGSRATVGAPTTAAKKTLDESDSKKKEKDQNKEEESDHNKSPKKDNDSKDESIESSS
uniref:Uncharacterized protein n=1 Tax=Panagrolaimus superbus TaxID=310955 RepID=A0A914YAN9_9BILA